MFPEDKKLDKDEFTIVVSGKLFEKLKEKVSYSNGEFKTIREYVEFILEEVLDEDSFQVFDLEDEEKIKERLKKLGYI
jgi:hypothetical protein